MVSGSNKLICPQMWWTRGQGKNPRYPLVPAL